MKSLLTKIISVLTIFTLCVGLCACNTPLNGENCNNGHNLVQTSYTAPTCKTNGQAVYKCSRCEYTETETLLSINHDYKELSATLSTCTAHGSKSLECSMCHESKTETLPLLDHDYELISETPSTCAVQGLQTFVCKDCKDGYTNKLDLLKHDYELKNTTPPTCTVKGSKDYECKVCNDAYSTELDLLPHTLEKKNTATCFVDGELRNVCSECDYEEVIEEVDMFTHDFGKDGYCTKCGIYETLIDFDDLNITIKRGHNGSLVIYDNVFIRGNLTPKFKTIGTIPCTYFLDHYIVLTLSFYSEDGELLYSLPIQSTINTWQGNYQNTMTLQYGGFANGYANQIRVDVSNQKLVEATSLKIEISCEGYKAIINTYTLPQD